MNARPTLDDLRACHARSNACLSWRRLSSSWRAACRRCAAALAPGPSWQSLSIRQSAFARTTVTLIALLISPITLPSCPGPASQPWALLMAATLDSAKIKSSLCRSGERLFHYHCFYYIQRKVCVPLYTIMCNQSSSHFSIKRIILEFIDPYQSCKMDIIPPSHS